MANETDLSTPSLVSIPARKLRFERIMSLRHYWEDYLKHLLEKGNPLLNLKLVKKRVELHYDDVAEEQKSLVVTVAEAMEEANNQRRIT